MKKTAATVGRKAFASKQKSKAQSARPASKQRAQALKATQDARVRDQVKKEQGNKTGKRPPAPEAQSAVQTPDFRKKVPANPVEAATDDGGKSPARDVENTAWAAELKRSPSVVQGAKAEIVKGKGHESREVTHDLLANGLEDGTKIDPAKKTSFGCFLPMEIALLHWQFWVKTMADHQKTCERLASNAAAWPVLPIRDLQSAMTNERSRRNG